MTILPDQQKNIPDRHARDVFHAWMVRDAVPAGPLDLPRLKPCQDIPNRLVAFSDAMKPGWKDFDCWVHFFEDDYQIERFWNNPSQYLPKLRKFAGVVGLDYSVGWNFPRAIKDYNHYRNDACTWWLSEQVPHTIPAPRCEWNDYWYVLAGYPKHSTTAIGARAMVRNAQDRQILTTSVHLIVDYLEPSHIVWYGSTAYGVTAYLDEKGIPYTVYPGKGRGYLSHHPAKDGR